MKPLDIESICLANEQLVSKILDLAFKFVHGFKNEIRYRQPGDLSLSAFRVLAFVQRHDFVSLTQIADHLGLMLPSTSKLVQELVSKDFLTRNYDPNNRRVLQIAITSLGREILSNGRREALSGFSTTLSSLATADFTQLTQTVDLLNTIIMAYQSNSCGKIQPKNREDQR